MVQFPSEKHAMGAPFSLQKAPVVKEVGAFGDMDEGNGAKVVIEQGNILFMAVIQGTDMLVGVSIEHMLDTIAEYNRETGN